MLIIARHKGQRVSIGQDVEVIVTELSKGSVKLGFIAPRSLQITRGELRDSVEEANRQAAQVSVDDALKAAGRRASGQE